MNDQDVTVKLSLMQGILGYLGYRHIWVPATLAVVVVVVSILFKRQRESSEIHIVEAKQALVPWFLWVFVTLIIINSAGGVSTAIQTGLNNVSQACLLVAISALGVKTSFWQLSSAGWQPLVLLLFETLWMAGFVLTSLLLRG